MNPYSAPKSNNSEHRSKLTGSRERGRISTVFLPAIAFPAGFVTTAAVFQSLIEGASSGFAYAKSLVFEFPVMFFSLAISYAILRAVATWNSLQSSVWLSFVSPAFALILFPLYFTPIAALIEPLGSELLGAVMMGVTPACVGLAVESLVSLVAKIARRLTPYPIKVAEQNAEPELPITGS